MVRGSKIFLSIIAILVIGLFGYIVVKNKAGADVQQSAKSNNTLNIGSSKFLFLDKYMLSSITGASIKANPPSIEGLVVTADPTKGWEKNGITAYSNVFWDPNYSQYRLYYTAIGYDENPPYNLALATSLDGVNWSKPNLGVNSWGGNTDNNIVIKGQREGTVILDPNASESKRYAYLSSDSDGVHLFTSQDGISWAKDPTLISKYHSDGQISAFWDDQLRKYIFYPRKIRGYGPGDPPEMKSVPRAAGRVETNAMNEVWSATVSPPDGYETNIPQVMYRDDKDPQWMDIYTNSAQKYAQAKNTYLAFPTPYYHYDDPKGYDPSFNRSYLTLIGGNDGTIETQLAVSRNGINWTRYRAPYVSLQKYQDLDIKIAMVFPGILYDGNHLHQYFAGYTFTHGDPNARTTLSGRQLGGIFRLEQRVDGFTSLDFDYKGGEVVTDPFIFDGERLSLNVNTSASGDGRVAILDKSGKEIPGFGIEDSQIINGDYLSKTVVWGNNTDVSSLSGKEIRLKFMFRGTKLYSFEFADLLVNIAPQAVLSASSDQPNFEVSKAADLITGQNGKGEWASNEEQDPWTQLNWKIGRKINKVVLYDRVNPIDTIESGTLNFSDGSKIDVYDISNDGAPKEIPFPDKTVRWVKFQIQGEGHNVGLSEIQVFGDDF